MLGLRALALARGLVQAPDLESDLEPDVTVAGGARLRALVSELEGAQERVLAARREVERHEARLDDAAVQAGETLMGLTSAVAELTSSRERLVGGGDAEALELADIDYQISALEGRAAEIRARQGAQSRDIELEMSPQRDRLVEVELVRQEATERLLELLHELRPEPCPKELAAALDELARLRRGL